MKPISVRFQCFGPYMAEQFIDFEELEKNGLFLICGETGAGKTTILDAMCYALYGRSSGGLRGDLSVMRCKLAEKNDETLVDFVFDCGGNRYKFVRSLKYGRKNLNDTHNCMVLEDGVYVPIFENPKATVVNKKAEELIGLSYDQFRQVIILPQGQFEKLLVSDSVEKEKILVSLFHADRWQKIAEELYRRVAQQDGALKQERAQIDGKLKEYGCEKTEELEEKLAVQTQVLAQLKEENGQAQQEMEACRQKSDRAILENRAFEELRRLENSVNALQRQAEGFDAEEVLLKNADTAEKIRPQFTAWQEAKRQKIRAEGQVEQGKLLVNSAEDALTAAREVWQRHEDARGDYEKKKQKIILLENAGELYRSLEKKHMELNQAEKRLKAARKEQEGAEKNFLSKDATWQRAMENQSKAMEDYRQAQAVYLKGIGSTLAQRLVPGERCPVCGSLEHPEPAKPIEGHVTDAQLEEKNKAMNAANDAVNTALRQRGEAEEQKTNAVTVCNQAEQAAVLARADYESALQRRVDGIEDEKQLESVLGKLRIAVAAYQQEETRLRQRLSEAENGQSAARAKRDGALEDLAAAQTLYASQAAAWQGALTSSGLETEETFRAADLEPEEKQRRKTDLIRFRADLERTRKEWEDQKNALEGRSAPDMAGIRKALEEAQKRSKDLTARQTLAENRLATMEKDLRSLKMRGEEYGLRRQKVDADLDFANRLRGRSGVSLQRYVLGVMLTSITAAANLLLKNVYGGRYRLYRTDEISGSGHKGGLELEVYDSQNNQRRSVTTLSGGEKFLVALSLAIGLSTVVQAQGGGIRLEAMFIDEGFGSLDAEAVNDALEVLQGIQKSSGVVGIISHVEQLAETVPTRLEIKKGKNGSVCHIHG